MADPAQEHDPEPRSEQSPSQRGRTEGSGVHDLPVSVFPPPPITLPPSSSRVSQQRRFPYRVVVAVDLTDLSEGLLLEGIRFARGRAQSEVHILTVVKRVGWRFRVRGNREERPLPRYEIRMRMKKMIDRVLTSRRDQVEKYFDKVDVHIAQGNPVTEILRLADDLFADLIVVGAGRRRLFRPTIAENLMMRSDATIIASRPEQFVGHQRVPEIEPPGPPRDHLLGRRHTYHVHDRTVDRSNQIISWEM